MTVGELKKMLEKYPDDMEVIASRYSDYVAVQQDEWSILYGVPRPDLEYVMRPHPTMSDENKAKVKYYLHLKGN